MIDAVIVLGNINKKDGELSEYLQQRLEVGLRTFRRRKAKYLITTGGFGRMLNRSPWPQAQLSKKYLMSLGEKAKNIKPWIYSRTTVDEIIAIRHLCKVKKWKHIVIVSSDFHIPRIMLLALFARFGARVEYEDAPSGMIIAYPELLREAFKFVPSLLWLKRRDMQELPDYLLQVR